MQWRNTSSRYGVFSLFLHWGSALVVFGLFGLGLWMRELSYYDPWYHPAPALHKSIGILLAIALLVRIVWRFVSPPPPAPANLASTQEQAQRYKLLVADQAVSKQQYADANAAYLQSKAAVEQARINLRYTKVLSPISGRIGRSAVTEGALVTNGQANAMATVQQLDPIYVDVTQPSTALLRLRRELASGQLERAGDNAAKVSLKLEDGSQYPLEGRLEFSEVSVDEGTGSVTIRAVFPNPNNELLPGMFVHAQLQEGVKQKAILAPQQGVTRDLKGQATALVVNAQNKVELRVIKADRVIGDKWLVTEGLNAGDKIITEGLQFVQPGVEVKTVPAKNVASAQKADAAPAKTDSKG